ncbi:hypothetical protein QTN25_000248 [Entamoeba marina]
MEYDNPEWRIICDKYNPRSPTNYDEIKRNELLQQQQQNEKKSEYIEQFPTMSKLDYFMLRLKKTEDEDLPINPNDYIDEDVDGKSWEVDAYFKYLN